MGECMSLCNTKNKEEDDSIKNAINVPLPINDLTLLKPSSLKETTPGKSKRTKSRTPKVVKFRIDQEKDVNSNQYQKKIQHHHQYYIFLKLQMIIELKKQKMVKQMKIKV